LDLLNLPTLKVLAVTEHPDRYIITAGPDTWQQAHCDNCLDLYSVIKHGTREQSYRDLSIHGKKVEILINRQRYRCKKCGTVILDPIPDINDKRAATNRLVEYIEDQSLSRTFASIAKEIDIDEKTVRNIFDDHVEELSKRYTFQTPRILGIDEVHLIKKPRCVLTNIGAVTIFDMLESRNKDVVKKYLQKMPNREIVELVSMDMWRPYREAVKESLPGAKIVVDKFHAVKMANEALEYVRKRTRENLTKPERITLMKDRFTLLKRKRKLTGRESMLIETWTKNFPALGSAYNLKEGFFDIWDCKEPVEAKEAYSAWKASIPANIESVYEPILTSMRNWETEIFAYFDHPITNAYTEAKNGLIKIMNRTGRGYSFEVLRAKTLFSEKHFRTQILHPPSGSGMMGLIQQIYLGVDITTFAQDFHKEDFEAKTTS
jgi:transposase